MTTTDIDVYEPDRIPQEIRDWFAGKGVLSERYGLMRLDIRHRVIEVWGYDEGGPVEVGDRTIDFDARVYDGEVREFRTLKGAEACAERWRHEKPGRAILVQHAIVFWMTDDELPDVRPRV